MSDMIRLTGLWKNKSKGGEDYLAGNLTHSTRILVFVNRRKVDEKDPDYVVFLAPKERLSESSDTPAGTGNQGDIRF